MTTKEEPEPIPPDEAAKARAAELIGRVVSDRYRIVELVAMGGMGAVYRGEHLRMRKRVAIKVLHPDVEGLPDLVARFEREAVAGAQLQHVNAAAATDFGELEDGSTFLVLEYVAGQTLHQVIREGGPLAPTRAIHIAKQLASVLGAAHAAGLVHRDVKPRNVMLVEGTEDLVKLIDFGLAKVSVDRLATATSDERGRRAVGPLTGEGILLGTVAYLAPEAALGMGAVDSRSDMYALGLILYEMLAGKHPFDAKEPGKLFKQQRFDAPPPVRDRSPGVEVPAELEAIAMRLLSKSPADRHPSGNDVVTALDAALAAMKARAALDGALAAMSPAKTSSPPKASSPPKTSSQDLSPSPGPASAVDVAPPPAKAAPKRAPAKRRKVLGAVGMAVAAGLLAYGVLLMVAPRNRDRRPPPSPAVPTAPAEPRPARAATGAPAPEALSAATAAPSAPAPPAESANPASDERREGDARAARAKLVRAVELGDWKEAEEGMLTLARLAPAAFRERHIGAAAKELVTALEREGGGRADKVFRVLSEQLGPDGLDLLYELMETRGGSLVAKRASATLGKREVLARATPALRIAYEMRVAPCNEKLELLERAKTDGDVRTLIVLDSLGRACFRKNRKMDGTIKALHARLSKP